MTVETLITELSKFPGDLEIRVRIPLDHREVLQLFQQGGWVILDTKLKPFTSEI